TVGNPILLAAVMLMTIPVSLLVAAVTMRRSMGSVRFWVESGLWVLIVSVQMQAIIYTLSRGPWIGTIFSLSVLLLLLAVFVGREALARVALVLVLAGGLTWIAISTAVSPGQSRPTVTAGAAAR
ncbi:MAG: hypothetical protein J4O06_12625, partial [Chloroflexi bacterium]|nr:hypothetical protein [Chloroflexota bacterium]